jgi:riboflavin biosynthesis pyrimidine reductase
MRRRCGGSRRGVDVVAEPGKRGSISKAGLMKTLAARGSRALVEGGVMLSADLLALSSSTGSRGSSRR